ncbi:MAG: biopolymer transporter ExbD [Syntrophobacterales bacterium]|nr:biopolymer transporter ExbD [Syntrophobacterales bacterium]
MKQDDEGLITEINVIPLVDIVLVILIIFLLVAQIMGPSVFKIKLPEAGNPDQSKGSPVTVWINQEGKLALNGYIVTESELLESVRKWLGEDSDLQVILSADERVFYGDAVRVLDILKKEGVKKLALQVQPK